MRECSTAGWVEGGQAVRVSLFLPDGPWPLRIDQSVGQGTGVCRGGCDDPIERAQAGTTVPVPATGHSANRPVIPLIRLT